MEARTTIETFDRVGGPNEMYEIFGIRPVVVDSSFLLPDVCWTARNGTRSAFLDSIDFGVIRPFAAHHVWAEVPRKIEENASLLGCDQESAEAVWWQAYAPRIRFVDVGNLRVPRLNEIAARDVSDAPTFALADLLAPVVVLARDRDVIDLEIATDDWVAVVRAGEELTFVAASAMGGIFGINLGGHSLAGSVKGIVHGAKHPVGQILLGAAGLVGLFTLPRWWPAAKTRVPRVLRAAGNFIEAVLQIAEAISEHYKVATAVWEDSRFKSESLTLQQQAARALAISAAPISRSSVARVLLPEGSESERRVIRGELGQVFSSSPAFVSTAQRRWQLGKAGPDFGVSDFGRKLVIGRRSVPPLGVAPVYKR